MLILIAESKTMGACSGHVSTEEYSLHCPELEDTAETLMHSLRDVSAYTLAREVKISPALASRLKLMIYDFPHKSSGAQAITAYTGVVFKAFDYKSLTPIQKIEACNRIAIISSLYGWVNPSDIIKPYRFDFTTTIAPGYKSLASYMKDRVTGCLIERLDRMKCKEVLNLLPADAAKCIDFKKIEAVAKVWRADFREINHMGESRTPPSNRLKTLRGLLLRQIITDRINSISELSQAESEEYMVSTCDRNAGKIVFDSVATKK